MPAGRAKAFLWANPAGGRWKEVPPCQPWSDLDFPRSFPLVAPVPLCSTPDVPCLVLPFQTMVTLSTLDLSGWMPDGFLVLIQWSHLSLECLRNSRLNVGPLFQPMAFPAKTDLTTGLAFGTSRDPGKASTFTVPLQPMWPFNPARKACHVRPSYAMGLYCFQSRST